MYLARKMRFIDTSEPLEALVQLSIFWSFPGLIMTQKPSYQVYDISLNEDEEYAPTYGDVTESAIPGGLF